MAINAEPLVFRTVASLWLRLGPGVALGIIGKKGGLVKKKAAFGVSGLWSRGRRATGERTPGVADLGGIWYG